MTVYHDRRHSRRWMLTAAAILALTPLIASGAFAQKARDKVKVATQGVQFTYGVYYVAKLGGFFEREGIDVEETDQNATAISISSVISGDTEFGLGPTSNLVIAAAKRQPVKVVARVMTGFPNMIVLRTPIAQEIEKTTGVGPKSSLVDRAKVLKGKTFVTVSAGSSLEIVLADRLRAAGLDPQKDVVISYSGNGTATAAALRAERVDGAVTGFPFVTEALMEKRAVLWFDPVAGEIPELIDLDFTTLFTNSSLIKSNPDLVQRMVNGVAKAESFIHAKPDEARVLLRKVFPQMKVEVLDAAFDKLLPLYPKSPVSTPDGFKKALDLMNKSLSEPVNVAMEELVDPRFAQQAVAAAAAAK